MCSRTGFRAYGLKGTPRSNWVSSVTGDQRACLRIVPENLGIPVPTGVIIRARIYHRLPVYFREAL